MNRNKNKGSAFEREVVEYLATHGHPYAERAYGAGRAEDEGDIDGVVGFCIEAKNHKEITLSTFMDEAVIEAGNINRRLLSRGVTILTYPVSIIKRRRQNVERAYVVMELKDWARLVGEG